MKDEIEKILDDFAIATVDIIYNVHYSAELKTTKNKILQLFQTKIDSCEDKIKEVICCSECSKLVINIIKERCK